MRCVVVLRFQHVGVLRLSREFVVAVLVLGRGGEFAWSRGACCMWRACVGVIVGVQRRGMSLGVVVWFVVVLVAVGCALNECVLGCELCVEECLVCVVG